MKRHNYRIRDRHFTTDLETGKLVLLTESEYVTAAVSDGFISRATSGLYKKSVHAFCTEYRCISGLHVVEIMPTLEAPTVGRMERAV